MTAALLKPKPVSLAHFVDAVAGAVRDALAERLAAFTRSGGSLAEIGPAEDLARRMLAAVPAPSRWNDLVGPFYTTRDVASLLGGVSRQAVAERRQRHTLLALRTADGELVYPAFQFTDQGDLLPGLPAVLQTFDPETVDGWTLAGWLVAVQEGLGGASIVDWLRRGGEVERALVLARDAAQRFAG